MSRYSNDDVINNTNYGTNNSIKLIRDGIKNGFISYNVYVLKENERLDILAGRFYNNSTLWWILASASNIGWGLQVPPGTRIIVPNLQQIQEII